MSPQVASDRAQMAPLDRVDPLDSAFASEAAFRAFYDRALPRVYGYVFGRCGGDHSLAEEITQQAFIAAVRERSRFDGRADPVTWLIGIARHKLADHFRMREREERRGLRVIVREPPLDAWAGTLRAIDEREAVVRALAALPAMQRAVLVLHYADGLSVREMASQLRKTESAVESLMTRARDAFRRAYGEPA